MKPVRDRYVFTQFHDRQWDCLGCGHGRDIQAHHLVSRGQGGDDVAKNLVPLCRQWPWGLSREAVPGVRGQDRQEPCVSGAGSRFLRSEPGDDARSYLYFKLGVFGAEAFVQKLEAPS